MRLAPPAISSPRFSSCIAAVPGRTATFEAVGNRKQIASTLAPVPAGLFNYDANERFTAGDTYDNDGNTVSSGGIANVYDFENHLVQKGGVTMVYDGDGNRVSKTVAGATTTYLVDTQNPTGYAQVVYETFTGNSSPTRDQNHLYVYGLELIGQTRSYIVNFQSGTQQIYYDYDGHGSVRELTDANGNVTDTYDYDAFGDLTHSLTALCLNSSGTITMVALGSACPAGFSLAPTPNNYLFAGEQLDPDLFVRINIPQRSTDNPCRHASRGMAPARSRTVPQNIRVSKM